MLAFDLKFWTTARTSNKNNQGEEQSSSISRIRLPSIRPFPPRMPLVVEVLTLSLRQ